MINNIYNALTQIDSHMSTAFSSQYHNICMNIQIHNNTFITHQKHKNYEQ